VDIHGNNLKGRGRKKERCEANHGSRFKAKRPNRQQFRNQRQRKKRMGAGKFSKRSQIFVEENMGGGMKGEAIDIKRQRRSSNRMRPKTQVETLRKVLQGAEGNSKEKGLVSLPNTRDKAITYKKNGKRTMSGLS